MPTTPSQLVFTEEVQTSTIGDTVPNPPAGSLDIFANQNGSLYTRNSVGAVTPVGGGPIDWVNVTQQGSNSVLPSNTAAQNNSAINAILAKITLSGTVVYFPAGTYSFSAAWTPPAATVVYMGDGMRLGGSTNLQWTANVAGTFLLLNSGFWYTQFVNITFSTTVNQTAGYVVDVNGTVGVNFIECAWQGNGGTFFNCINYAGANGANQSVVNICNFTGFSSVGINVNSNGASLVLVNTVLNGQWGTSTQCATACMQITVAGAVQIDDCDMIGAVNNLLINPAVSNVVASVYCSNTYFDNSLGSCLKITGAGATVRCKFTMCSFTCSSAGAGGYTAVEVSTTVAAGAQGLDFLNCSVLNTFGATGTTNGFLLTGAADINILGCRVAGWTNGIQVTANPTASTTILQIIGNIIGTNGGYGVNTVGILLNASAVAYGAIEILNNDLVGNTTALTNSVTTNVPTNAGRYRICDNAGYNPHGAVTTPAIASGSTFTNTTGLRVAVLMKTGATVPTVLTVNGVTATSVITAASSTMTIPLDPGGTISVTYTVAPTWIWVGN